MALCLAFRVLTNLMFPLLWPNNFTMTHLKVDSLLAGVFVSYLYYFRIHFLKKIFIKYKPLLYVAAFLGVMWTPFLDPMTSFFAGTIGLTLLLISFGIILIFFLLSVNINQKLNFMFSRSIADIISKIGFCSYSIYIIHTFFNMAVGKIELSYHLDPGIYFNFIFTSALSILTGMFMTYRIENYFLKIRDRYYPNGGRYSKGIKLIYFVPIFLSNCLKTIQHNPYSR